MGKGIVLGGAALQGSSLEERPGGHQVCSHLQVGSVRGCWVRAVEQRETIQSKVRFGNNCEAETRGSPNDRFKVFEQAYFFSKCSYLVCDML